MDLSESQPASTLQAPAASATKHEKVYQDIRSAIHAGDLKRAHRLLLTMITVDGKNPELWLLLAWTAPTRRVAEAFYKRLLKALPDYPRVIAGVPWSGKAWGEPAVSHRPAQPPVAELDATGEKVEDAALAGQRGIKLIEAGLTWLAQSLGRLNFTTILAFYMLGITLAEAATTFIKPHLGLVIHGMLLVAILLHASLKASSSEQKFLLALGLAPLIRLISLSMPLLQFDFMYWYMIIGIPLLVASAAVYRLSGYKPGQIGLSVGRLLPLQLGVGLVGVGLGFVEYLILRPEPLVQSFSLGSILLPALILLIFTGFLEELIFRGLMQRASVGTLKRFGPLYISLLFAVLHIGYKSWVDLLFVFLVGFAFSFIVERTRSLMGVTLAHGLTNISLFLIFPFLLAGSLQPQQASPPPPEQVFGPALWSGPLRLTPRPTLAPLVTITDIPNLEPPTPTPFATFTLQPADTPISTELPSWTPATLPTNAIIFTPTPSPTRTPPPLPSPTALQPSSPTPTATPLPNASSTPTITPVRSPTPTSTRTPIPTDVLPVEPTVVPTDILPEEPSPTP